MPHCRVTCGHCSNIFFINKTDNSLTRCPHCQQVSSIGSKARWKGILYSVLGILFLCIGIGLATGTVDYSKIPGGINVAYFLVFLSALLYSIYAYKFFRLKTKGSGATVGTDWDEA